MIRTTLAAALVLAAAAAAPAFAQQQAAPAPTAPAITLERALVIAADRGLVRVRSIELDDGEWEVEGWDAQSRRLEVDVNATSGQVVKFEYDR